MWTRGEKEREFTLGLGFGIWFGFGELAGKRARERKKDRRAKKRQRDTSKSSTMSTQRNSCCSGSDKRSNPIRAFGKQPDQGDFIKVLQRISRNLLCVFRVFLREST